MTAKPHSNLKLHLNVSSIFYNWLSSLKTWLFLSQNLIILLTLLVDSEADDSRRETTLKFLCILPFHRTQQLNMGQQAVGCCGWKWNTMCAQWSPFNRLIPSPQPPLLYRTVAYIPFFIVTLIMTVFKTKTLKRLKGNTYFNQIIQT